MGPVGLTTAVMLASVGHVVEGVDIDDWRITSLIAGRVPFAEPELAELMVSCANLYFSGDSSEAVRVSDFAIVCVGTPANADGAPDLSALYAALGTVADGVREAQTFPVVIIRSTFPPTEWRALVQYLEHGSGKTAGVDFGVCANPEFLREGSAVADFKEAPYMVIGCDDGKTPYRVGTLYARFGLPLRYVTPATALMLKYACNAFHALKVTFSNEIGDVCRKIGVEGDAVLSLLADDTRLNVSRAYLHPGAPFGGSCLPKDVAALMRLARDARAVDAVLSAIALSNDLYVHAALSRLLNSDGERIGVIGLSFKSGTDDVRLSPAGLIIESLLASGRAVCVYDPEVSLERAGQYRAHMVSLEQLLAWSDVYFIARPELAPRDIQLTGTMVTW